jgi:translation initiation factor 6
MLENHRSETVEVAKHRVHGSDFVGAYVIASDKFVFCYRGIEKKIKEMISHTLSAEPVEMSISDSHLIGIFARANSNGIVLSDLATDDELAYLRSLRLDLKIGIVDSRLNAVGNNILANDKIAFVNSEYSNEDVRRIGEILDVEVVKAEAGGFKTVGANNILTNAGFVLNNRSTEKEKQVMDSACGFESVLSTANTGSLAIGLASAANSRGIIIGDATTGYELNRILESLEKRQDIA